MIDVRLPYWKVDSVGFNKLLDTSKHISESGLPPALLHMLYLRVSQINGCGYCVDVHRKDMLKAGVDDRVINGVVAWHHTPFFTPAEQAALEWCDAVTRLEGQDVPQPLFDQLKEFYSEEHIMAITLAVIHMNALNRLAIAFGRKADL